MKLLWSVFASAIACLAAETFSLEVRANAEVVAELELRSPGADWAVKGREAAVATVLLDNKVSQHVILYGGPAATVYRIFPGSLTPGRHTLSVEKNEKFSAHGASLEVVGVQFHQYTPGSPEYNAIHHAPVLFARRNTVGLFSDVPLIVYSETLPNGLRYTVIFSNEDGGTSTRALMARWGRTTDIEYVYNVSYGGGGRKDKAIVQGPDHKDLEFTGPYEESHPLLMPVTDNNMVAGASDSPLQFRIAPLMVDLSRSSRESVMDANPVTYAPMLKELEREGKLRPFGTVDGEKISDVRNYLFVDYTAACEGAVMSVSALLKDGRAFSSDLGRLDYAICRQEPVRTTIELPPGTRKQDISRIGFGCQAAPSQGRLAHHGMCRLRSVNQTFFMDRNGRPDRSFFHSASDQTIATGQSIFLEP